MKFQRPIVPSRWIENICFGVGSLAVIAIGLYGLWAARRGFIEWREIPIVILAMLLGALPVFIAGYIFRGWRLKKAAEMSEYERVLAAALDQS